MAIAIAKVSGTIESAEAVAVSSVGWASDTGTPLNAGAGEQYQYVNLQVSVDFHASATLDAVLHLRKSADNGATENTEGETTKNITIANPGDGSIVIRTVPVYGFDYLDVGMENLDTGQIIEGWTCIFEGLKYTGLS